MFDDIIRYKRIAWVDNLKAIGIILVVLTHHQDDIPKWFIRYIYSFHVPLFFFASGLVFQPKRYTGSKTMIIDKAKTLLVPYLILSFLAYGFYVALSPFRTGEPVFDAARLLRDVTAIFISSNGILWMPTGPLWFLTSLFVAEVIFYSLYRVNKSFSSERSLWVFALLVFLVSIVGALDKYFVPFRLPWGIDTAMTGATLFSIGFFLREIVSLDFERAKIKTLVLIIFFAAAGFVFSQINSFVNMTFNMMGNYVHFYVAGLSGIGLCLLLSKIIPENRVLRFIGSNSLLILGLHLPAFVVLRGIQRIMVPGSVYVLDGSFQGACMYTVIQLLILVPVIYLVNRHFRFVLGRW